LKPKIPQSNVTFSFSSDKEKEKKHKKKVTNSFIYGTNLESSL